MDRTVVAVRMSYATPRLKYPFKWGYNGHAQTVEQDSDEDILQRAFAILNTKLGSRLEVPNYGLRSQVLKENGPSLNEIEAALHEWEPKALVQLSDQKLEDLKSKLVNVGIGVTSG